VTDPETHPLVSEVMKKAAIVWIGVGDRPAAPAWTLWIDGAAYLIEGGAEQPVPGLTEAAACTVTARSSSTHARIVTWEAAVSRIQPDTDDWRRVAPQLLAKRLNLSGAKDNLGRWASECSLLCLTPGGAVALGPALPDDRLDAAPPLTPAATRTTIPYTIGLTRRPGRRKTRRQN
jgi:hypothetical protein